jgi:glycosyltransferase involved in cell wall biosynthesis
VLAVGRLVKTKGFGVLVGACRHLRDRGVAVRCEIVGSGPRRPVLEAKVEREGLEDRVALQGALPFEKVEQKYASADVVAVPSRHDPDTSGRDGLPNVVIEALAAGLPVVGSNYAGIPDLIQDGVTGRLVPPGDDEALADALHEVRDHPERAADWARAGREEVRKRYNLRREVQRLVNCMQAVKASASGDGPANGGFEEGPFGQFRRAPQ